MDKQKRQNVYIESFGLRKKANTVKSHFSKSEILSFNKRLYIQLRKEIFFIVSKIPLTISVYLHLFKRRDKI